MIVRTTRLAALLIAATGCTTLGATTTLELEVEAPTWGGGERYAVLSVPANGRGAWDAAQVPLRRDNDGRLRARVEVPAGAAIEWKVTRGSWATVEKGPQGEEVGNRRAAGARAFAHVSHWADDRIVSPAGRLVDLGEFAPGGLPKRRVLVHLPAAHEDPLRALDRFPVLYALDGQNQLQALAWRSFAGTTWSLDRAADAHAAAGRAPFIAVAIDNTAARMEEYTPGYDPEYRTGGKLELLSRWLIAELKPTIDHLYRTRTGPDDTALMGSSLGGLASLVTGLRHADAIGRVGVLSPSLFWNGDEARRTIESLGQRPPLRIWLDMGTAEGSGTAIGKARAAVQALTARGWVHGWDLAYREIQGGRHDEAAWAARLPDVLAFLFP